MSHRDTSCVRLLDHRPDSNADHPDFGTHAPRDCHVTGHRIHPTLQPICNSRCHTQPGQKRASHLPDPITFSPDIKSGGKLGIV